MILRGKGMARGGVLPALLVAGGFAGVFALAGCGNFLHTTTTTPTPNPTPNPTPGGGTNLAFVANQGSNTVSGFSLATNGSLAALSGSPISLGTAPLALAVSRDNSVLWVGTVAQIFAYSLSNTGAITALNKGLAVANATCIDMQTTPDGKWLMVLDGSANGVDVFSIGMNNVLSTTGSGANFQGNTVGVPRALRISPAGTMVAAALGQAGEYIFGFNTTTGLLTQMGNPTLPPATTADYGIAFDNTGSYLYVARTGANAGLVVEAVGANGSLTPTTNAVYATGASPYAVVVDHSGKYVYVANHNDNTITAYGIGANAALTPISGSPFAAGSGVNQLAADSTGTYVLAVSTGGSPDLEVYGFDATVAGKLTSAGSSGTGTTASFLALSH